MKRLWKPAIVLALLAVPLMAQDAGEEPAGEPRRARRALREGGGAGRPGAAMQQMVQRLKTELNLDEAQQKQFDELVARMRESVTAQAGNADTRETMRQIREARQRGDDEQVRKLREQLRAGAGGGTRAQMQSFYDDLEAILRDDQKEKLGELRDRMMRGGGGAGVIERVSAMRERLNLNERQGAKWDELFTQFEKEVAPSDDEPDVRGTIRQMRESGQEPDPEKLRELREQAARRGERNQKAMSTFFAGIEPVLTDEQRATLAEIRAEVAQAGAGDSRDRDNPRAVLQAARRLELTREQKDQLKQIEQAAGAKMQDVRRDPEAARAVRADVEKQIREILTPEQVTQFEAALQRGENRGNRGSEGESDRPRRRRGAGE